MPAVTTSVQVFTGVTSRATRTSCDGEEAQFPVERGSIEKHHPAWNPQRTHKSREVLCPKRKVVPRFSLGDVGETRWLVSHRWTETSPILPDVAYDSRYQRRLVSLSALSHLTSPSASDSASWATQVAASADSLTAHGRRARHTDGSPVHL